jgi:hypothetical protein
VLKPLVKGMSIDWLFASDEELYLYAVERPRKGAKRIRRRAVEDMSTSDLADELGRRLREERN